MISELLTGKDVGGVFTILSWHLPGGTEEKHKNSGQDS